MLSGSQLATAITAVLVGAIVLGWVLHWIWMRLSNAATSDTVRINQMTERLERAERARTEAETAQKSAEQALAAKTVDMDAQLVAMQTRLDGEIEGREAELTRELREAKIDADTAMSGLRNARERITELEDELTQLKPPGA